MPQWSLLIAVRFHQDRYHGQEDRFNAADGWPPSPGRLFQALVAGAAKGASLSARHKQALTWFERLDPPTIAAPAARRGRAVTLFVPNNDLDSVGGDPAQVSKIRVSKQWRPTFFDPGEPVLYLWNFESGSTEAMRICAIADRMYQLGRGIDMAWASAQVLERNHAKSVIESHPGAVRRPGGSGEVLTPRPGTLDSLVNRYQRNRRRLTTVVKGRKTRQLFAQPPKASFRRTGYDSPSRCLYFELRGSEGRFAPRPLASVAPLIAGLRDAAAARLQKSLPEQFALFERLIIGRGAGPADLAQRIRLIAVPSIGTHHTDPSIRRLMLEIPSDCPLRVDDLKWAFAGLQPFDRRTKEAFPGRLVSINNARMAGRFARSAHLFRSITPVALSGATRRRVRAADEKAVHQRIREERRAATAAVQALRHAGFRTRPSDIRVQKEPFQRRGVRAELFADGSRFSPHALWHLQLRFREAISGPVVIGDGRFYGLGLMEPVSHRADVLAFGLTGEYRIAPRDRPEIVRHLRRALMALARDETGRISRLFSGHESNGFAGNSGHHTHVFLAADNGGNRERAITRLIVAAPWTADRRAKPQRGERRQFEDVTRQLRVLRAGRLGRFHYLTGVPLEDGDPLLGPAKCWVGRTPYVATRNLKRRDDPASVIKTDVTTECVRRGLPKPVEIRVLDSSAGPRGGRPTARLKLRFAVAVPGPLLLGRDSHSGGGLFHSVPVKDHP